MLRQSGMRGLCQPMASLGHGLWPPGHGLWPPGHGGTDPSPSRAIVAPAPAEQHPKHLQDSPRCCSLRLKHHCPEGLKCFTLGLNLIFVSAGLQGRGLALALPSPRGRGAGVGGTSRVPGGFGRCPCRMTSPWDNAWRGGGTWGGSGWLSPLKNHGGPAWHRGCS